MRNFTGTEKFLRRFAGRRVLAGVSGGADSLAALLLCKQAELNVEAVHFEHGIRGAESAADAAFVEEFCKARALPCRVVRLNVPDRRRKGENLEAAARRLRLEAWQKLTRPGDVVVLGHHRDDATENLLLRMARGGNTSSLTNLRMEKDLGALHIVRPLLRLSRLEIENFLKLNGVNAWRTDSTNLDPAYQRNFLRNHLLREWESRFPAVAGGLAASLEALALDADFIENAARAEFGKIANHSTTRAEFWKNLHPALLPRVAKLYFHLPQADSGGIFNNLTDFATAAGSGSLRVGDLVWRRQNGVLTITAPPSEPPPERVWRWRETPILELPDGSKLKAETTNFVKPTAPAPRTAWFATDALPDELRVTGRRAGDRLKSFGGAEVSVKKLFIDRKLPFHERRDQPIVRTPEGEIVWIPNVANAALGKVPEGAETAIKLTFLS